MEWKKFTRCKNLWQGLNSTKVSIRTLTFKKWRWELKNLQALDLKQRHTKSTKVGRSSCVRSCSMEGGSGNWNETITTNGNGPWE
jgi:hypothetical protein